MFLRRVLAAALSAILLVSLNGVPALADGGAGDRHWVYDELAEFKQRIRLVAGPNSTYGGISEDEKEILRNQVLNEELLDKEIRIEYWATLLKAVLKIPAADRENLLSTYAYGLATGDYITREDAVGGMVKLLTVGYIKGSATAEELEPANALRDLGEISDRQDVLVRVAYSLGLVDSRTVDYFRPRDLLTVAEAVSMMNRVIAKFSISYSESEEAPEQPPVAPVPWIDGELQRYRDGLQRKMVALKTAESILTGGRTADSEIVNSPVLVNEWAEALEFTLNIQDKQAVQDYTAGLVSGETVPRGVAVAGLMKLLHFAGLLEARDATEKELLNLAAAFADPGGTFDASKLAIAYAEGLVRGYPGGVFRPEQALTRGEALMLMLNVIERYM